LFLQKCFNYSFGGQKTVYKKQQTNSKTIRTQHFALKHRFFIEHLILKP